jgi:2-dehydropantoate 2-reductase
VGLIARGEHLETVRRRGLHLEEAGGRTTIPLRAFASPREAIEALGPPRFVILTVKAYDVAGAVDELAGALGDADRPLILCLQNGLESEEMVARRFGREVTYAGAITLSVERPCPGEIRALTDHGGITIAPFGEGSSRSPGAEQAGSEEAADLLENLSRGGFRVRAYPRGDAVKWSKALLNLWANASSAIFDRPPGSLVSEPALFHLDWLAFREALRVMSRAGIPVVDLPGYPVRLLSLLGRLLPERLFRQTLGPRVAGGRGGKMPSFWLDLQAGRGRTEVTYLNGAVARAARRMGLEAPANEALTAALEALSSGALPRTHFVGRPALLL